MSAPLAHPAWLAAAGAIALRLGLMAAHPALFGGDSVVRLANADRIALSYQLPALQACIHAIAAFWPGQWGARLFVVVVGGVAAAGLFRFARTLMQERAALAAAVFFAVNPFLAAYSIVPYQEMLMLAGLSWAFAWAMEGREGPAAAALALACLTRYEAWLACPALLWLSWRLGNRSGPGLFALAALYGAAPLGWMLWNGGLTPAGSFAVESALTPERLWRWAYLSWIVIRHGWFLAPLAALGAWSLARERRLRRPEWQAVIAFGALFAVGILLSAHGEREQPERFVTAREAHLPLAFVCLLAGQGLSMLRRGELAAAVAVAMVSVLAAQRFVASETAAPRVALALQGARLLGAHVGGDETVAVLAKPVPADALERFLRIAERQGGAEGRARAIETLRNMHAEPPDYQRILVQTRLGREQLRSLAELPVPGAEEAHEPFEPDWVLAWSDFEPSSEAERALGASLDERRVAAETSAGELTLRLYR